MRYDPWKAFPHPVLRPQSDDYVDGAFQATVRYSLQKDAQDIEIEVNFLLSEPSVKDLLASKKACYAVLVVSRDTYFRDFSSTTKEVIKKSYLGGQLSGNVTIFPFILAKKDIPNHKSDFFNKEFKADVFPLKSGDVIALDRPQQFYVGQEIFAPIGAVFELVEDEGMDVGSFTLGLDSEKVQILVSPEQKVLLDRARNQKKLQSILMVGIYLPAVMEVLMKMSSDTGDFDDKKWYRAIRAKCDLLGIQLSETTDFLDVTQKLLSYPVRRLNKTHLKGK